MNQNLQSISLDNFEQLIDTRILERGFEYYKNEAILSIEQIDKGIWEAVISGNENYEVAIHLGGNVIINNSCNCPYDLNTYCKHQVAVLNFIKYSDLAKNPPSDKLQKIRNLLDSFSPEEIKDNLLEILKFNKSIRKDFLEDYEE